jgi:neurofibromin 1
MMILIYVFLQAGLWKTFNGKPFWETPEPIDIIQFSEALACAWRFLPEKESLDIFNACTDPERSDAVKTCAVRACLLMTVEVGSDIYGLLNC